MSTRCLIGIEYPNNEYKYVYNHWDGYPEGVGVTLINHYNSNEKIQELLNRGDISSLGNSIEETEFLNSFKGYCKICNLDMIPNLGQDYIYVFRNNEWVCKEITHYSRSFFSFNSLKEVSLKQ